MLSNCLNSAIVGEHCCVSQEELFSTFIQRVGTEFLQKYVTEITLLQKKTTKNKDFKKETNEYNFILQPVYRSQFPMETVVGYPIKSQLLQLILISCANPPMTHLDATRTPGGTARINRTPCQTTQ